MMSGDDVVEFKLAAYHLEKLVAKVACCGFEVVFVVCGNVGALTDKC